MENENYKKYFTSTPTLSPTHPKIEHYINSLHEDIDCPVLKEMESHAETIKFPIIGREAGRFLHLMTKISGAKKIFEFGSGFGYSAYFFTLALPEDGKIILTEENEKNVELGANWLKRVERLDKVDYHCGLAQDVFKTQDEDFDIIFCDVDKYQYPDTWLMAREKIKKGGLYIADNVLWMGRVTDENFTTKEDSTKAVMKHNKLIADDKDFEFIINPVRDGIIVARRK